MREIPQRRGFRGLFAALKKGVASLAAVAAALLPYTLPGRGAPRSRLRAPISIRPSAPDELRGAAEGLRRLSGGRALIPPVVVLPW
jgi:hypothetical protein